MKTPITLAAMAVALSACATVQDRPTPRPAIDFYAGLDSDAQLMASSAIQTALETVPSNRSHFWSMPSGVGGSITPIRTVREPSGRFCRDFRETLVRSSQGQTNRESRACRNPDSAAWQPG